MVISPAPRYQALDVLRGVAILGILFANIPSFGSSWYEEQFAALGSAQEGVDAAIDAIRTTFISGKFRSLLAVLFGIGLYLQFQKRTREGNGWPGGYVRRMLALALIGVLHICLLWIGDILLVYSVTCLVCMWFLYAPPKTLRILTLVGSGLVALGALGLAVGIGLIEGLMPTLFQDLGDGYSDQIAQESFVFAEGTYWQQVAFRIRTFLTDGIWILSFGIGIAPLFLVGAIWAQMGILSDPETHRPAFRRIQWWTLGVGIPLNLLGLLFVSTGAPLWLMLLTETLSGPLVAVGVAIAVILAWKGGTGNIVTQALSRVGKLALSCYLLQSLIASVVFYSWGGRLFEKLTQAQLVAVAVGIDLAIIVFAVLWSRTGKRGPAEWLHRKLSGDLRPPKGVSFQL